MALRSTTRSYRGEPALVDSDVDIAVRTYGDVPEPTRRPEIVARIGVGLNPFGVENSDDLAWLTTLTWPEHVERRDRMRAAADVVATDRLDDALALVPDEAIPVVFHSAVLNYFDAAERQAFVARVTGTPRVVWLANEGPGVLDGIRTRLDVPSAEPSNGYFILCTDGQPAAVGDPHGAWIRWPE